MFNPIALVFLITCSVSLANNDSQCDFYVAVGREIKNDGFHRLLEINVRLGSSLVSKLNNTCYLAVHQVLPSGMFVDPEQLDEFFNFKKPSKILHYINETIDIEASENASMPVNVYMIYNNNSYNYHFTDSNVVHRNFTLPVHTRYHLPQYGGQYRKIVIPRATILVRCESQSIFDDGGHSTKNIGSKCAERFPYSLPCDVDSFSESGINLLCGDWFRIRSDVISFEGGNTPEELVLTVPVGDMNHYFPVQIITLTVTNFSAICVLYYLLTKVK